MMLKLYYAPGTCALACWIALEWAGADYSVERVDPKSEAYRAVNPLGMVPALDIGGARAMTQAAAILQYIADRYGERNLGADAGLDAKFEFNETMAFLTGDFHPAFWPFFSPQRYTTNTDQASLQAAKDASHERVERVLTHLDELIADTGHVYGGKRSVADAYAFVMARWSSYFPRKWQDYAHLSRFMEGMSADSAVARILAQSQQQ